MFTLERIGSDLMNSVVIFLVYVQVYDVICQSFDVRFMDHLRDVWMFLCFVC